MGQPTTPSELLDAGRADEAIRVLTPQATGNNAAAYNLSGTRLFLAGRLGQRGAQLRTRRPARARNAIFQLWLGRSYGEKASVASPVLAFPLARKTVAAFATAHSLDRQNMAIAHDLAEYYVAAPVIVGGGDGKALALAAELAPEHPSDAAWVRAMVDTKAGHYEEAEREYTEEIRLAHDSARSYLDLAHFLKGRKSWDRMQQTVERAMHSAEIRPVGPLQRRRTAAEKPSQSGRSGAPAARLYSGRPHPGRGTAVSRPLSAWRNSPEHRRPQPGCRRIQEPP